MTCFNCHQHQNVTLRRCTGCLHVSYCSKHRPNCIPPHSSLHELFKACQMDVFPVGVAARDYGLQNMRLFHGNFVSPDGYSAETILLGLYQVIWKDIGNDEFDGGAPYPVLNSIGTSKRMIAEAFENNALDDFLHRYINNIFDRFGSRIAPYGTMWLQNRLIIGPTRPTQTVVLTRQVVDMRNEISRKYYGRDEA